MKKGILFIGHGSRFNHNKEAVEQQANALKERTGLPVRTAYNETTMPLVDTVLEEMVNEGIEEIIAVPFFVASGLHITRDIPRKLSIPENSAGGKTTVNGKEVTVHFEKPLGEDPNLTDILEERVKESCNGKKAAIMVVGHGSRLPYNEEIIKFHAERLRERGYPNVYHAFNEFNEPYIEEVMKEIAATDVTDVAVLPMFIASGAHLGEEVPETLGIPAYSDGGVSDAFGRELNIHYAMPVGKEPRLAEVLVKRLEKYGI
ncbi:MAG: sirohydrochlorin chelatase [Candidatus Methanomethylophilaceae archaeon]|jgi:sirohydrochlorin ferrochelatase